MKRKHKSPPHQIILTVVGDGSGSIEAEVQGIVGPGCQEATEWLGELGEVVEHRRKAEFYQAAKATGKLTTGKGSW